MLKADVEGRFEEYTISNIAAIEASFTESEMLEILSMKNDLIERTSVIIESLRPKVDTLNLRTMKEVKTYLAEMTEMIFQKSIKFWEKHIELFSLDSANKTKSWKTRRTIKGLDKPMNLDQCDQSPGPQKDQAQVTQKMGMSIDKLNSGSKISSIYAHALPSDSVKILNEWVKKNKEDPYPGKQEKEILAAKANMTVTQVNNWLVNYRSKKQSTSKDSSKFKKQIFSSIFYEGRDRNDAFY